MQRRLFENRSVPEHCARGIVPAERVEHGEAFVRFAAGARILRRLGQPEELVGEARDLAAFDLGAFARDPSEALAGGRRRRFGRPQRRFAIPSALVLVRGLEVEERARVAAGLRRPRLAPRAAIGERLARHPLVELA